MVSYHDNDYMQRKLDHYNSWLLNPKRKVEDGPYKGFPEDVKLESLRKSAIAEATAKYEAKAKEVKPAKVKAVKAKRVRKAGEGPTKQERAIEIYRANIKLSKDNVIAIIREQLDMSPAGATTYYYNAKKLA